MATAKSETITRLVSVEEPGVTLHLSNYEALHLIAVCRRVGGANPHRHVFSDKPDSILDQLYNTGLASDDADGLAGHFDGQYCQMLVGHLMFSDDPPL